MYRPNSDSDPIDGLPEALPFRGAKVIVTLRTAGGQAINAPVRVEGPVSESKLASRGEATFTLPRGRYRVLALPMAGHYFSPATINVGSSGTIALRLMGGPRVTLGQEQELGVLPAALAAFGKAATGLAAQTLVSKAARAVTSPAPAAAPTTKPPKGSTTPAPAPSIGLSAPVLSAPAVQSSASVAPVAIAPIPARATTQATPAVSSAPGGVTIRREEASSYTAPVSIGHTYRTDAGVPVTPSTGGVDHFQRQVLAKLQTIATAVAAPSVLEAAYSPDSGVLDFSDVPASGDWGLPAMTPSQAEHVAKMGTDPAYRAEQERLALEAGRSGTLGVGRTVTSTATGEVYQGPPRPTLGTMIAEAVSSPSVAAGMGQLQSALSQIPGGLQAIQQLVGQMGGSLGGALGAGGGGSIGLTIPGLSELTRTLDASRAGDALGVQVTGALSPSLTRIETRLTEAERQRQATRESERARSESAFRRAVLSRLDRLSGSGAGVRPRVNLLEYGEMAGLGDLGSKRRRRTRRRIRNPRPIGEELGFSLGDILAPLATVAGTAIGGPAGGAVGSLLGGILGGGGGEKGAGAAIPGGALPMSPAVQGAIAAMPSDVRGQVKDALREVQAEGTAGRDLASAVAAKVDQDVAPQLQTVISALEEQRAQAEATQEHRDIVRREAKEREDREYQSRSLEALERIEGKLGTGTLYQAERNVLGLLRPV